jgi:ATP-dependent Lon protease
VRLYKGILSEHDWGQRFEPQPSEDLLDSLMDMPPREMRRALMTGFGNARLDGRYLVRPEDLPQAGGSRQKMGFLS